MTRRRERTMHSIMTWTPEMTATVAFGGAVEFRRDGDRGTWVPTRNLAQTNQEATPPLAPRRDQLHHYIDAICRRPFTNRPIQQSNSHYDPWEFNPFTQRRRGGMLFKDGILFKEEIITGDDMKPWPDDAFEQFWAKYPHKVGKGRVRTWFRANAKKPPVEFKALMEGLERYIASKPFDHAWCNPGTFLNQERWDDEPDYSMQEGSGNDEFARAWRSTEERWGTQEGWYSDAPSKTPEPLPYKTKRR